MGNICHGSAVTTSIRLLLFSPLAIVPHHIISTCDTGYHMTASDDKSAVLGVAPFGWHHNKEAHASAWRSALLLYIFLFPASSVRGSLSHVLFTLYPIRSANTTF